MTRGRAVPDDRTIGDDTPEFISLNSGHRLAYAEYGDPAGVPVMFLHGTPGSRLLGALFADHAENSGVRLIAVDRPGFGHSQPRGGNPDPDPGWFIPVALDELGIETVGLIAFSGGSRHAVGAAARDGGRISRADIVSGATPPDVREGAPRTQLALEKLAATVPFLLRGVFRGQAWIAGRLDPTVVVKQYTTGDPEESVPSAVADIVKADFVEALSRSRRGTVTEFRHTAMDWGVDFEAIDIAVQFWHGDDDTNVPIGNARRFESDVSESEFHVLEGADHLQTLLRSVPEILTSYP